MSAQIAHEPDGSKTFPYLSIAYARYTLSASRNPLYNASYGSDGKLYSLII